MRLFLSSYRIGSHPERLVDLVGEENKRVAIITNAGDYHTEDNVVQRLRVDLEEFEALGLKPERLDLRSYFNQKISTDNLSQFGLVWMRGGNVFILRRAIEQSGLLDAIVPLLGDDKIVFGGYSAGACVLTPTLHGIDLCDDPTVVPEKYRPEIIWDGLDMVPFSIAPHYKSDHPETELIDKSIAYFDEHSLPYETLHDGEAITVNGGLVEKLL